jgi:translation initiation factor IF-3
LEAIRRDFRRSEPKLPDTKINEDIRVPEVRVIGEDGTQLGILQIEDAQQRAQQLNLDLVEVAPEAKPPVCRIMNYGKYLFQQSKKAHEAKKRQKQFQVKEIKFRPNTDEHDFQFKKRHVERFLADGDKVKITIIFRGRERAHKQNGVRIIDRLKLELEGKAILETHPKMEGIRMVAVFSPDKG